MNQIPFTPTITKMAERFKIILPSDSPHIELEGVNEIIQHFANIGEGTMHNRHVMNAKRAVKGLLTHLRKENAYVAENIKDLCEEISDISKQMKELKQILDTISEANFAVVNDIDSKQDHIKERQEDIKNKLASHQYLLVFIIAVLAFKMIIL